jgi:hypothetical protein
MIWYLQRALLAEQMEVGLGPSTSSGPVMPGLGFSSPSPHVGGMEQGTYLGGFSGGVVASSFVHDSLSRGVPLSVESKAELKGESLEFRSARAYCHQEKRSP